MAKMKMVLRFTANDLTGQDYAEAARLRPEKRLEPEELAIWDRIAPLLAAHDYLNDLFVDSLVEYCRVVHSIDETVRYLRQHGKTYTSETRNGLQIKNRPQVGELGELRRMLRSYVSDFGLSPQARKALEAVQTDIFDDDGSDENPFTRDQASADAHIANSGTRH
ncbi:P27 family phage terminase small subunit [Methylomonas sp. MED-D]|uniref:P27 family phage terminase small subunit n=1 Tax=Methylomonas sp. MED-D TaxID=3418768 RepID=UPI003CFD47A4